MYQQDTNNRYLKRPMCLKILMQIGMRPIGAVRTSGLRHPCGPVGVVSSVSAPCAGLSGTLFLFPVNRHPFVEDFPGPDLPPFPSFRRASGKRPGHNRPVPGTSWAGSELWRWRLTRSPQTGVACSECDTRAWVATRGVRVTTHIVCEPFGAAGRFIGSR